MTVISQRSLETERCSNCTTVSLNKRANINFLMMIYFASGICSLIDEVIWVRLLKLSLGNTVYATTIVVSMFMAGLALGALIMSRYSDEIKNRLRLYALIEILITIAALLFPLALKLADKFYIRFYRTYAPTLKELLAVQVVISGLLVLGPSMLMGSTLPLLGRYVTSLEKQTGRMVGRLYTLNTLGAAVGCFLAGFVLIRSVGVMGTLYTAAIINIFVAFAGWLLSRFSRADTGENEQKLPALKAAIIEPTSGGGRMYTLLFALFFSGLISIGYELLWMRSIVHLLSGYTYVFSSVLTIYLLGNVIGAGIGSGLVRSLKNPAAGFAVTLCLLGICGIFYLPLLIYYSSDILPQINREVELAAMTFPVSAYMIRPLVQSAFLYLLPSIIMGMGFPLALQAWASCVHKVGRTTGTAYGTNTIGAVVGGIATGFILIPLLGLQLSMSVLSLAGIWISAFVWMLFARSNKPALHPELLVVAALATLIVVIMPPDLFKTIIQKNPRLPKQLELIAAKEGPATTVSLHRDPQENTLYLYSSGQGVAGDTYFLRSDQKMLGHFGVLLNSKAKRTLSVGYGSGESTACMALYKLERADCVEIAPEVVELSSEFFSHINLGDRLNNEIGMIYMDAKNYLHLTDVKYDTIVNDSINPQHFAENSSLYSKEYFKDAKNRLNENGLFAFWIPTYNIEPLHILNSAIGTMMEVFPHVTIWYMTPDPAQYFLVIGSEQPQQFSPRYIESQLSKDGVRENLSEININSSMDVLSCYIGDEKDLRRFIRSYTTNSDFRPFIEFTTADKPSGSFMFRRFIEVVRSNSVHEHIDWNGFSRGQKSNWLSEFAAVLNASNYLLASNGTSDMMEKLSYCMEGLAILPDNPALINLRKRTEKEIFAVCSDSINSNRTDEALRHTEQMLKIHPRSAVAWLIKSLSMQQQGKIPEALETAKTAVLLAPDMADARFVLGSVLSYNGQPDKAITEYNNALELCKKPRKFAIYSHTKILDILARTSVAFGENTRIGPESGKKIIGISDILELNAGEASSD
ncbi:MAG: fused MFS/spermidine synthase [Sedimentisphaerales bacterium]|nr:fused MFS/spermidine synthase [Sedimentisphaerales bacterium]